MSIVLSANGEVFSAMLALGFLAAPKVLVIRHLQIKSRIYCAGISVVICHSVAWESDRDPEHSRKSMIWGIVKGMSYGSISIN